MVAGMQLLLAAGCGLGDPAGEAPLTDVSFSSPASSAILNAVRTARSHVRLALNRIVDKNLIIALNDAAARGVRVELVVDSTHEGTTSGISSRISFAAGNPDGEMNSNFAIIDSVALFFSDADLTNQRTIALRIQQDDLVTTLASEFYQMHDNGLYGSKDSGGTPKQKINHQTVFETADGAVEMYFLPQNDAITYISARMKQAKKSVDVYGKIMESASIAAAFTDIGNSGLPNYFCFGNTGLTNLLRHAFIIGNASNTIVEASMPVNSIFVDAGTIDETLLFTTFPYDDDTILSKSDGVVIFVRGNTLRQIQNRLGETVSALPKYSSPEDSAVSNSVRIATFNALRLGENQKAYPELARVIQRGGFDLVGIVELMVGADNANVSIGDGAVLGVGKGLSDLAAILQTLTGENWSYHVSPTSVGSASYSEYYGFIYKTAKIASVQSLGFYNDPASQFVRRPYGATFTSGNADFTLVLQHAIYGSSESERRAEASALINVYNYFRSAAGSDRDVIIAGDFNLAADDTGFTTLYSTVDKITWAIHPSTATTVGDTGFVSAYDNIFYSKVHSTEVLTLQRGAWRDWVNESDFSPWAPTYTGNNYKFANTYISDHIPVFITFNTTEDDD